MGTRVKALWAAARNNQLLVGVASGLLLAAILAFIGNAWAGLQSDPDPPLPGLWGPNRTIYRCADPRACQGADHITFNSTVNAVNYGDERAFVDVKPASIKGPGHFSDELDVQPGERVLLRIYIDNNANEIRGDPSWGIAHGTTLRVELPAEVARAVAPMAFVSATDSLPRSVWDGAWLRSDSEFSLEYVFGSAQLYIQKSCTGPVHPVRSLPLLDTVVSDGVLVGSPRLDGRWTNTFCASGIATLEAEVVGT